MAIRTFPRSGINNMAYWVLNVSRGADANTNQRLTKTEVDQYDGDGSGRYLKKLHRAALTKYERTTSVSPSKMYAFAKSLLPEIRQVVDTRGNRDGALQDRELRYLSADARTLARFRNALPQAPHE